MASTHADIRNIPVLDGLRGIACHQAQRERIERYVLGMSKDHPDPAWAECNTDCMCAQWLHNPDRNDPEVLKLINQICGVCEVFKSMASQAVSLAAIGKSELAREMLKDGSTYSESSAELQRKLMLLHTVVSC